MEAIKIISQTKGLTDRIDFYGNFDSVSILRGIWIIDRKEGIQIEVDGLKHRLTKIIFDKEKEPMEGQSAKVIILHQHGADKFTTIGTNAQVYVLGSCGQTLDKIY